MKPTKFRFNKNREITASINFCVPKLLPKSSGNIHLTNEKKTVHNDFGLRTSDKLRALTQPYLVQGITIA